MESEMSQDIRKSQACAMELVIALENMKNYQTNAPKLA
jgi:hypothetical protein